MKRILNAHKQKLIGKTAEELKKVDEIAPPTWSVYVKTGTHKERAPTTDDWWYYRSASLLLKTLKLGPIGITKLRTKYGGRKRRGHKPAEFRRASGNILRKAMQQLEKAGLVKQVEIKGHKGRVITPKGLSLLNSISKSNFNIELSSMTLAEKKPEAKPAKKEKGPDEAEKKQSDAVPNDKEQKKSDGKEAKVN
ncbi:30S ribosomal protein S19e [Candidatus Woesearchaeota archaeon]|nr:30S ribosomal protein S19e [Candidatus Woesearchaeota archaeon]